MFFKININKPNLIKPIEQKYLSKNYNQIKSQTLFFKAFRDILTILLKINSKPSFKEIVEIVEKIQNEKSPKIKNLKKIEEIPKYIFKETPELANIEEYKILFKNILTQTITIATEKTEKKDLEQIRKNLDQYLNQINQTEPTKQQTNLQQETQTKPEKKTEITNKQTPKQKTKIKLANIREPKQTPQKPLKIEKKIYTSSLKISHIITAKHFLKQYPNTKYLSQILKEIGFSKNLITEITKTLQKEKRYNKEIKNFISTNTINQIRDNNIKQLKQYYQNNKSNSKETITNLEKNGWDITFIKENII